MEGEEASVTNLTRIVTLKTTREGIAKETIPITAEYKRLNKVTRRRRVTEKDNV